MTPQSLPLFPAPALPPARVLTLGGYRVDETVLLADLKRPGFWRRARVIAVLPRLHQLVLRAEAPAAIVDVNPILHPHLIRRPA